MIFGMCVALDITLDNLTSHRETEVYSARVWEPSGPAVMLSLPDFGADCVCEAEGLVPLSVDTWGKVRGTS